MVSPTPNSIWYFKSRLNSGMAFSVRKPDFEAVEYIRSDIAQAELDIANKRIAELEAAIRLANKTIDVMDEALGRSDARIAELSSAQPLRQYGGG